MGTANDAAAAALAPFAAVAFAAVAAPPVVLLALEAAELFGGVSPPVLVDLARDEGDTFLVAAVSLDVSFNVSLVVSLAAVGLGDLLEVVLGTRNFDTSLTSSSSSSPSSYTT